MNTDAMKTFAVAHPRLNDLARIIAVSDIHGNLVYLHFMLSTSLMLMGRSVFTRDTLPVGLRTAL